MSNSWFFGIDGAFSSASTRWMVRAMAQRLPVSLPAYLSSDMERLPVIAPGMRGDSLPSARTESRLP
jgi:hypothetical protein